MPSHFPIALLFLTLRASLTFSLALAVNPQPEALQVHLSTGTFLGTSTSQGLDEWLGIRFAQAPIGTLRFKAPVPVPTTSNGPNQESEVVLNATTFGNACPQLPANLGAPVAEDCLFLNVFRPSGTSSSASLPVLVWIHGGQYTSGAGSKPAYDPTIIIQRAVTINSPIIFVSINYRLNTFGFLASAHVAPEDLNAGLLDQRLALEFIQDNIAAFGGDPRKVTIWGQSAGAGSIQAHMVYPASRPLFRAAIAESAVGPFKNSPPPEVYDQPDKPFARLLANVGCPPPGPKAIACLQAVPFETLLNISNTMIRETLNTQLWQPTTGTPGSFAPVRASVRIEAGDFLHVPYLAGTNRNEGTTFSTTLLPLSPSTPTESNTLLQTFIQACVIDNTTLTPNILHHLTDLFPSNIQVPFQTGNELFDRSESWYGHQMFLAPRRLFFERGSGKGQEMWAYHFTEFIPGNNVTLGVAHASELNLIFQAPVVGGDPPIEDDFANTIIDMWLTFVYDMNPGHNWPKYTLQDKQVLQLQRGNITIVPDDWDLEKTIFMNTPEVLAAFQK